MARFGLTPRALRHRRRLRRAPASRHRQLITVDPVIYPRHFNDAVPPRDVGAKLLGGHKRYAKTLHLVRPLPLPGTQAVFLRNNVRRDAQAYTSAVERVVFNYHAIALELSTDPQDAWADVTNMNLR